MLKRKLLTLACVAGVLICGACGMMFREPAPPKPPMTLFVGIHTVRVVVTNSSATRYLDSGLIQREIVSQLNLPTNQSHLRAVIEGDADGTLSLDVVQEDAQEDGEDANQTGDHWLFHAVAAVKLTNRTGQVLRAESRWNAWHPVVFNEFQQRNFTPGWSDPAIRTEFAVLLARQLAHQIAFQ
jgi:hypothetical protein